MSDLISRISLKQSIAVSAILKDKKTLEQIIDEEPSIDAVPVVRCAECKWFQCNMSAEGYLPKGVDEFECRHWCGSCDPVDFCSYGEREENG